MVRLCGRKPKPEPEGIFSGDVRLYRLMKEIDEEQARRRMIAFEHGSEPTPAEKAGQERRRGVDGPDA